MFGKITVEYYGTQTPVNQLASFHMPEPRMIVIQPFDKGSLAAINRAIGTSDLGVNPNNDGAIIRVVFPELSEERRKDYIKVARHKAEEKAGVPIGTFPGTPRTRSTSWSRAAMRARTTARRGEAELEKVTHTYVAQVDDLLFKHKETELLEV